MSDSKTGTDLFTGIDRRAARTRRLLAEAMFSLGAKDADIDALEVSDIAEEAGVSRSTFYQHFASKDDFLVRSFVDMIARTEAAYAERYPDRTDVLPSRALFTHIGDARGLSAAMTRSTVYARQMRAAELKLREIAEANLERRRPDWSPVQRQEAAVFIAGGFIALLKWWREGGHKHTPQRMQEAFEQLVGRVLIET
ncbi:transcriptional regulator of TetR family [alpha proteobacterium U9-1i]|nr:transcriptional regulator of TetR family [alpha proteobacterium U9-1i]